jgi:sulfite dehydrogenase (cytochrome) subunit A
MAIRRERVGSGGAPTIRPGADHILPQSFAADALTVDRPAQDMPAIVDAPPGKCPLVRLSDQPPNYETPIRHLGSAITPADAFFVRYNLHDVPSIDPATWRLSVGGEGAGRQAAFTLDDLMRMPSVEVTAVCQCSGNRRSLFEPRVDGIQWGHGAVGCARWKGVRLKEILDAVGMRSDAIEILLDGADTGAADTKPDFIKSIPVWKAREDALIAYAMNGEPLPRLNGFPARIVVPGWTATYWIKHVTSIAAATRPFDGYWMRSSYRVPRGQFPGARFVSQENADDVPITEILVNSLITSHQDGDLATLGARTVVAGIAWDGGHGIRHVEVSTDGGDTWARAELGQDLGRFAFRPWSHDFIPRARGGHVVLARATSMAGHRQPAERIANPCGYHHNAISVVTLTAM